MKKYQVRSICAALSACGLLTISPAIAAPLSFSQSPAGSLVTTPPAPNLILTLDNSGSMNTKDAGQAKTRFQSLRSALKTAFSEANLPENAIRLGWNTLNNFKAKGKTYNCSVFSDAANSCGAQGNIVRPLTNTHRQNFLDWVDNVFSASGSTPTHNAYQKALQQFELSGSPGKNSPWAEVPGTRAGEYLTCRKSYVMLLTDGDYNVKQNSPLTFGGAGQYDLDNYTRTLGDGTTVYDVSQPYSKIYKQDQNSSTNYRNTLADLAFHYWAEDIDGNSSNNNVRPLWRFNSTEYGVDKFWNPKNNPATWQHVSTYTIGYGVAASGWSASPKLNSGETMFGSADLRKLMQGTLTWPKHTFSTDLIRQEMLHVAVNGRGKFYPARSEQDLVDAVNDMLNDIVTLPTGQVTSVAGSSISALMDSDGFRVSYNSEKWSGNVEAVRVLAGGGSTTPGAWGTQSAASLLDAKSPATRKILTSQPSVDGAVTGTQFGPTLSALSADQQAALGNSKPVLDYLRGVRTGEGSTYRERDSVLGDIVNSSVWYMRGVPNAGYTTNDYLAFAKDKKDANRKSVVFVGANDGMLHAFDAANGEELFAYVPQGAYTHLASLSSPGYTHRYFVDGSPFTADYCAAYAPPVGTAPMSYKCTDWRTMLVGFMGAGGKGFFALDVTDPTSVAPSSVKFDTTSGILPGSSAADPDIGHIFQQPVTERNNPMVTRQITRLNNGKWALVIGNGYNSTSEKAVLIIQYLDGSAPKKIYADATANNGNGLSAPRLVDLNGDSIPDVAYAGDLHGNLYKFDLMSSNPADWKVAGGAPIFSAVGPSSNPQPITTAPVYTVHPEGGLMLAFGTGRNLTDADRGAMDIQSFYAIRDNTFTEANVQTGIIDGLSVNRAALVSLGAVSATADGFLTGDVTIDYATKKGWYLDLSAPEQTGWRALRNPGWFDGEVLNLLIDKPAVGAVNTDPCEDTSVSPAKYYTMRVAASSGKAVQSWVDLSGNIIADDGPVNLNTTTETEQYSNNLVEGEASKSKLATRYFKMPTWYQLK